MSYSEVITKRPHQMTTSEIKAKANADAVVFHRQEWEQNPNPQTRYEYEQACNRANTRPDAELNRLYDIPMDKLRAEFETKGKTVVENNLEEFREGQARVWLASQPRYTPNPAAAKQIVDRINALGLKGTVHELQFVFEQLVEEGKIEAPPVPVELYTREELNNMSAAEMKEALQRMGY